MEVQRTEELTQWISTIEREGNQRHTENMERLVLLEQAQKEQNDKALRLEKKIDMILDLLSQGKGVLTLIKFMGLLAGIGGSLALIYESMTKWKGH